MGEANCAALCLYSAELVGFDVPLIEVEVHVSNGLPRLDIVGLAETCVRESRQRVRAAIITSGWTFPDQKITINLAPPSIKKMATGLDLAMAIGILQGCGIITPWQGHFWREHLLVGELGLSGRIRPISGILNVVTMAKQKGFKKIILPAENCDEASLIPGLELFPALDLREVVDHLSGQRPLSVRLTTGTGRGRKPDQQAQTTIDTVGSAHPKADLGDIRGQSLAKDALLVAAAGGHNLLFVGPPGAGKTFLARCLPGILPPLSDEEAIETTRIYSCAGLANGSAFLIKNPPFRAPHHSISDAGLVGGGKTITPGEISLAHNGVLFLDEFTEFKRNVLELLREPLESGLIHLSRAEGAVTYPARIQLVAAMNPCPCGYAGVLDSSCHCSLLMVRAYRMRISGPLLDRLDLRLYVHSVPCSDFFAEKSREDLDSAAAYKKVCAAREKQWARYAGESFKRNAQIPAAKIRHYCRLEKPLERSLQKSVQSKKISARGIHRLLRVARTLADMKAETEIDEASLNEALNFCQIPAHWQDSPF